MPIYMIPAGENGPVKIGHSHAPEIRLGQLQISHWEQLRIIRLFAGGEAEEAFLHERFADLYIRGEWHHFSRAMMGDVGLVEIGARDDQKVVKKTAERASVARSENPMGSRLFEARIRAGLSQVEVAKAIGVSKAAVSMWEKSTCSIRSDRVSALAGVLNVSTDWLLNPTMTGASA